MTDAYRARHPDGTPQAVTVLLLVAIAVPPLVGTGVVGFLTGGPPLQGPILVLLSAASVATLWVMRRTGSLFVAGHGLAAVVVALSTQQAIFRGGIEGGAFRFIGFAPLVATFVLGSRAGLAWAAVSAVDIAAFVALDSAGATWVDSTPSSHRYVGALILAVGMLAVTVAACVVFRWGFERAISARAASEKRFRALVDAMPDFLFRISTDGVVIDYHASRRLAFPDEAFVGRPITESFPQLAELALDAIRRASASGRVESFDYELQIDGVTRQYEARVAPHTAGEVLLICRDLSRQRRLEANLTRAERDREDAFDELKILRASRMAALGQLAAGVGHEVNNPLAYVSANVAFARERCGDMAAAGSPVSDVIEALDEAREGVDRAARIVSDLRSFARTDPDQEVAPVEIGRVIDAALKLVANEIRHRAKLVTEGRPVLWARANEGRLTQVLVNLLTNAAQAIPEGAVATNRVVVRLLEGTDGRVVVEVADTGVGISPDDLRVIAEPFVSRRRGAPGLGLGLAISKTIVEAHGGELTIRSAVGEGTTVRIELPAASAPEQGSASERPLSVAPSSLAGVSVLVVDDDPQVRRATARLFGAAHVVTSPGGTDALRRLREGERYDLVLCDLMMPDLSGMDFLAKLADELPEVVAQVVFTTGGAFTPQAQRFVERDDVTVVPKPARANVLRRLALDAHEARRRTASGRVRRTPAA